MTWASDFPFVTLRPARNRLSTEGDREAAVNLASAARTMSESPGAMQLRTLQTIDGLGPGASNTVVLAVPLELMDTIKTLNDSLKNGYRRNSEVPA